MTASDPTNGFAAPRKLAGIGNIDDGACRITSSRLRLMALCPRSYIQASSAILGLEALALVSQKTTLSRLPPASIDDIFVLRTNDASRLPCHYADCISLRLLAPFFTGPP